MKIFQKIISAKDNENEDQIPTLTDYYSNLTPFVILSIFIAVLTLGLNTAIFYITVSNSSKHLSKKLFVPTIIFCSLYPVISVAATVTILLPKSWLICHTVMHLSFTVGAIVLHNLCYRYVNSEATFIKEVESNHVLNTQTPPCCCCCFFLPKMIPTKAKLCIVKYFIWQMPVVQGTIMVALNVTYYRSAKSYDDVLGYSIPLIVASFTFGLWGLNITVRMINKLLPNYSLMKKMLCLQLILLLCKLQYLILDKQLDSLDFYGVYPITNTIYKQTIINLLILMEMILVSTLAQSAYSKPVEF